MKKIKRMKTSWVLPFLLLTCLVSCKNDISDSLSTTKSPQNATLKVENGRLTFLNKEHLQATVKAISNLSDTQLNTWEKSLTGFSSLRSATSGDNDLENSYLPSILKSIMNRKGQYKVGNDIVYINNEDEYIIKNNNETLLTKVINKDKTIDPKASLGIIYKKIKTQNLLPTNNKITNPGAKGFFQDYIFYQFPYKGFQFRFKYLAKAWIDNYFVYVQVFSFFEYYQGGIWKHAGQPTTKTLDNLTFSGSYTDFTGSQFFYLTHDPIFRYDNQDINIIQPFATDQLWITISGKFSTTIDFGYPQPTFSYTVDAEWDSIFIDKLTP